MSGSREALTLPRNCPFGSIQRHQSRWLRSKSNHSIQQHATRFASFSAENWTPFSAKSLQEMCRSMPADEELGRNHTSSTSAKECPHSRRERLAAAHGFRRSLRENFAPTVCLVRSTPGADDWKCLALRDLDADRDRCQPSVRWLRASPENDWHTECTCGNVSRLVARSK